MESQEFTCPICEGHTFKSNQLPDGSFKRYCTGRAVPAGGSSFYPCNFEWHQKDDKKFIKIHTLEEHMADFDRKESTK